MCAASNLRRVLIPDTPVFDPQERESLQRNPHLRPFVAITKAQVAGFLSALGEYAVRVGETAAPPLGPTDDLRVNDAHHGLLSFYWRPERLQPIPSAKDFVFNDEERRELGLHKYVGGSEHLGKAELVRLLEMLTVYSQSSSKVEQIYGLWTGAVRIIHAHNALIDFRDRPLTLDEFAHSVRNVLARCEQ